MQLGHIDNLPLESVSFSESIYKALTYLRTTDCTGLAPGRHNVSSADVFLMVQRYRAKDPAGSLLERHERYVDIQFLAQGSEYIGYCPYLHGSEGPKEDRLAKDDIAFYPDRAGESHLLLLPRMYALFYPTDLHRPGCVGPGVDPNAEIVKLVFKIRLDLA